jgi:transposase
MTLRAEADDLEREITLLVTSAQPQLLALPGVGAISAAQVLISWSHTGRFRSEAAFAAFSGAAPIHASSGLTTATASADPATASSTGPCTPSP